ncbi:hypothetical protein [Rhodopseudomonas sp. B29]|uniref:hypothetical protein n=1 Tax=Rhodopseudomonas sp. B29 TaxID=95607 RepID=UPI0003465DB7|nr:hypothetical protein [Rhodopseudomonas sp. B29]
MTCRLVTIQSAETPIGDRLRWAADEMSLLSDRFTDAMIKLEAGVRANSVPMIRSAQLSFAEILDQATQLNVGIEHAIQKEMAR